MADDLELIPFHNQALRETAITRRTVSSRKRFPLEPAHPGVGRFTTDGRWILATESLCRMLGYRRGELLRTTIKDITHPDDWPREKQLLGRITRGKKGSYTISKRYVCRSGLPLRVTETVSAVRGEDGNLCSVAVIEVDERKRTAEFFQLILEASPRAITIANAEGKILLLNSATERIFGYERSELLGKPMDTVLPDVLDAQAPFSSGQLRSELMQGKWDSNGRRKDGAFFPVEVGVRAVETGAGMWTIISIVDLSESGQAEERSLHMEIAS